MNEMETLLGKDREAGVPEPPDARYTVAAVRRRLGETRPPAARPDIDWPLVAACAGTVAGGALAALTLGVNPWWLLLVPCSMFPLFPILMRKGAR